MGAAEKRTRFDSTFQIVFWHAYNRIWKGKWIKFWEIFLWSIFAAYAGFEALNLIPVWLELKIWIPIYIALVILTPITIGHGLIKAHVAAGGQEENLRIVPLKPSSILLPRAAAV